MKRKIWKWYTSALGFSSLILIAVFIILFFPPPKDIFYLKISNSIGIPIDGDAGGYCLNARNPGRLLEKGEIRQNRPLFTLPGIIIGYPLQWIVALVNNKKLSDMAKSKTFDKFSMYGYSLYDYIGFYGAYIILNFILLLGSCFIFQSILRKAGVDDMVILGWSSILVCNDIIRNFFWTAHQQLFALFTPLLTIFCFLKIIEKKELAVNHVVLISLLAGLGILTYGNFLILFVAIAIAIIFKSHILKDLTFKRMLLYLALSTIIFVMPFIVWKEIVVRNAGCFYNHEIDTYRQLIWIYDAFKISSVHAIHTSIDKLIVFIRSIPLSIAALLVINLGIVINLHLKNKNKMNHISFFQNADTSLIVSSTMVTLLLLFLIYVNGFYPSRLFYTALPAMLIASVIGMKIIDSEKKKVFTGLSFVIPGLWVLIFLIKSTIY